MNLSCRLFACAGCHAQVIICCRCDRGQCYCAGECSRAARRCKSREARQRYQASPRGRAKHAACQSRYRARKRNQTNKVTDQGSLRLPSDGLLPVDSTTPAQTFSDRPSTPLTAPHCHFCGRAQSDFFRIGPLRRRVPRQACSTSSRGGLNDTLFRSPSADSALLPRRKMAHGHHCVPIGYPSRQRSARARPSRFAAVGGSATSVPNRSLYTVHSPDTGEVSPPHRQSVVCDGARAWLSRWTGSLSSCHFVPPAAPCGRSLFEIDDPAGRTGASRLGSLWTHGNRSCPSAADGVCDGAQLFPPDLLAVLSGRTDGELFKGPRRCV